MLNPKIQKYELFPASLLIAELINRFIAIAHLQLQKLDMTEPFDKSANLLRNFSNGVTESDLIRKEQYQIEFSENKKESLKAQIADIWEN